MFLGGRRSSGESTWSRFVRTGICTGIAFGLIVGADYGAGAIAAAEDSNISGGAATRGQPATPTTTTEPSGGESSTPDAAPQTATEEATNASPSAGDTGIAAESAENEDASEPAMTVRGTPTAGPLPAVFATGGSGRFKESLQWLQWADYSDFAGIEKPNVPILDYGQEKVFTNFRDMGEAGRLMTTCTLSDLQHLGHAQEVSEAQAKGPLVATIPGAWAGDALDNLYNVGGAAGWSDGSAEWHEPLVYPRDYINHNQMVIGLANGYAYNGNQTWDGQPWGTPGSSTTPTGYKARVSFDVRCLAELVAPDGSKQPVPLSGLVFADAEASSTRSTGDEYENEWVQASVQPGVTWRVLDTLRSANCQDTRGGTGQQITTNGVLSDAGRTLQLRPTGQECVYQNNGRYSKPNGLGGPDAVMFMEGATSATITLQGSGYSAVALGLIIATDFGDAPESYGKASSLFQPTWQGGAVDSTQDLFTVNPQANFGQPKTRLGDHIDAEGYQLHSSDAQGDDRGGSPDDEDGLALPPDGIRTQPGATWTQQVSCTGPGRVAGWVDWNHNGTFEAGEKSNEPTCAAGSAHLDWTVPTDVVRSVDGETGSQPDTFMRVRIAGDPVPIIPVGNGPAGEENEDDVPAPLMPTGNTTTGEVEDYKVAVRVPTLELIKNVDGKYASAEVPMLNADRWTLTGQQGAETDAHHLVTGKGTAGRNIVASGEFALSETSDDPSAVGYEASAWACRQTDGTNAGSQAYSSVVTESSVVVKNQDRVTCEITNTTKPGALVWKKIDEAATPLAGSEWTLTGPEVPGSTVVTDCTQAPCPTGSYADQDPAAGSFELTGLKWGTYSVTESKAPIGYNRITAVFTFPQITGAAPRAQLENNPGPDGTVIDQGIVNKRLTGSVAWSKEDMRSNALAGSEWTLTGPGVPAGTTVVDCVASTADQCAASAYADTDPKAGSFKVIGLSWSNDQKYSLQESAAPAGYQLDATLHEFMITTDALDYVFAAAFQNRPREGLNIPLTGGMGADALLIAGGVLIAAAIGSGAAIRRRRT